MVRKLDVNLNNKEFIINALKENKRLDGRSLLESRPIEIEFGAPLGCVTIKLGECKLVDCFWQNDTPLYYLQSNVLSQLHSHRTIPRTPLRGTNEHQQRAISDDDAVL